jgi:WhiB family redox-sensing transcriptional regulator
VDPAHFVDAPTGPEILEQLLGRPAWHASASCRGMGTERWFPERRPGVNLGEMVDQAKAICATCPVTLECLAAAVSEDEQAGVWGGLSTGDRRRLDRGAA